MNFHLYRLVGPSESLLYVGVSSKLTRRLRKHRARFGGELVRWESTPFETLPEALRAETKAIRSESPHYNVAHNRRSTQRLDDIGQIIQAAASAKGLDVVGLALCAGIPEPTLARCLADFEAFKLNDLRAVACLLSLDAVHLVELHEAAA